MLRRPNIQLLMADQHRADILGCAGDPVVATPNVDRLAAEGVRFDLAEDPLEERNLVGVPEAAPAVERMLEQHVHPFLATPPRRPHPGLIERLRG